MKRGDIVAVAAKGHYSGKPRPALILQSDLFSALGSVTICLLTTEMIDAPLFRLSVEPSPENGLKQPSQIMIDKIVTVPSAAIGAPIGALDHDVMVRVDRSLAVFLGIV
ncbi:type II toxin-antitoxin system PemK/MazF family toxin [Nitrospira moscoviensis]|uniref:Toxin MazF n=1 Tax=Nitrospira moscoviensis TaxID=42253 RepID=A0A0K2GJX6_NITMO|nr:type II toxin-antitoxin system PemK/MazF family toxin [Nitrospira moscoviensis]ALA61159.1 Toxin MazF [Nitrospira moscoviensis]